MKVFTFNIDEKDFEKLKEVAEGWNDADGKPWPVGRLVRHILSGWLRKVAPKKRVHK